MQAFSTLILFSALILAIPAPAVQILRINGDSVHTTTVNEESVFVTFNFGAPGDTVGQNVWLDVNKNGLIDAGDLPLGGGDTLVDGQGKDLDSLANGKFYDPGYLPGIREDLRLWIGTGNSYKVIVQIIDGNDTDYAVLVDNFAAPPPMDTILSGRILDSSGNPVADSFIAVAQWKDSTGSNGPEPRSVSFVGVNGRYGVQVPPGDVDIFYGPASAILQLFTGQNRADSITSRIVFTKIKVQAGPGGDTVSQALDLYYVTKPYTVHVTALDSSGDTLRGDSLTVYRYPFERFTLPLSVIFSSSGTGIKPDTTLTGEVTGSIYIGRWIIAALGRNGYFAIDTIDVILGDTLVEVVLTPAKPGVAAERSIADKIIGGLTVAPNPIRSVAMISFPAAGGGYDLKVFDIQGRRVAAFSSGRTSPRSGRIQWYPGRLPSGIYVIQVRTGRINFTKRVFLQR